MKTSVLARLPFLEGLPPKTIAAVNRALKPLSVPGGTVLFHTGDDGDACYLVETGILSVTNVAGGDVLATLGEGSFVGELALILREPRTATVTVVADALLLELKRRDLDALMAKHPDLSLAITRELGRRIIHTNKRLVGEVGPHRSVVWPASMTHPLADSIVARGHRIGVASLGGARLGTMPRGAVRVNRPAFGSRETSLTSVLIAAPDEVPNKTSLRAVHEANHVLVFGDAPAWLRDAAPPNRLVRVDDSKLGMRRAVRWATGRAVGIALSSGGSKTIAHMGVIRVLRAAGVEFDAVAGSSGGAISAMGLAFDREESYGTDAIADIARSLTWRHVDFNFPPRSGLLKGRRLRDTFAKWNVGPNMEDSAIPVWVVGADVATGDAVIMSTGSAADAMRASMSVPGALDPWRIGEQVLIDGAVANPLPTDVLRDAGVGIVLASNVAGQATEIEVGAKLPGLPQIMSRVLNTMERERINSLLPLADVVIRPHVAAGSTFDFSNIDQAVEAGVVAAESRLDDIRKLLRAASDLTSAE